MSTSLSDHLQMSLLGVVWPYMTERERHLQEYILDIGQKVCHLKSKPLKISMLYAISEVKTEHYYFHVLQVALEDCRRFHEIVTKQRNT